jgi:hypothetical protein
MRNASLSGWMQPNSSAGRVKCVELAEDRQVTDRSAREAPPSQFNLVVTFVDGTTGVVLASNDAYNAHLPALPVFGS